MSVPPTILFLLGPQGEIWEILGGIWLVVIVLVPFFFRPPRLRLDRDWKSKASARTQGRSPWVPLLPSVGDWRSREPTPEERRSEQNLGLLARLISLFLVMLWALYEYFIRLRR